MTWFGIARQCALLALILSIVTACAPSSSNSFDEEKDPHFITGKNKSNGYDYTGAVEAFEKALETNPRSASAHFEIGLLFYQHLNDHAAAIYHFEKFLALNPKHPRSETVKQFVISSKQELARTVSLGPINQQVQKELDRLVSTNSMLIAENTKFRDQVQQLQAELSTLRNTPRPITPAPQIAPNNPPANPPSNIASSTGSKPPVGSAPNQASNLASKSKSEVVPISSGTRTKQPESGSKPASTKTYTVAAGDTPAKIGRRFGVSADRILAANPGLDPRKMKVGMVVTIP